MWRQIASIACVGLTSFALMACDDVTGASCSDPVTEAALSTIVGSYLGKIVLDLNNEEVPAALTVDATRNGCELDVRVWEQSHGNCGARFTGALTYSPGTSQWIGEIETIQDDGRGVETTARFALSPLSTERVGVEINILVTTEQLCKGRILEGELRPK